MAGNTVYTTDNCSLGLNDVNGGVVQTSNFSDGGRYAAFNNTRPGNISVLNGTTGVDIHDNQVHGAENNYAVHFDSTASNNLLHNNDEWAGSLGYEGGYTGQNSVYSNIHH